MARNDGIDRTFARNQDLPTLDDVAKVQEHNEREKDSYSNQDIDTTQTYRNIHFKAPTDSYTAMFDQMIAEGAIHAVRLKQKSQTRRKKKITAAIYEYQADCDGEWGEISVDFENGTAEIIRLADWDTIKTNWFANEAIRYILSLSPDALKKYMLVPLEPPLIS